MQKCITIILLLYSILSMGQGFSKRYRYIDNGGSYGRSVNQIRDKYCTLSLGSDSIDNYTVCTFFATYNDTGKLLSSKIFRANGAKIIQAGKNFVKTKDSCFVNAGYIFRDTSTKDEGLLVKFDSTGEVLWYKTYGRGIPNSQFFIFRDVLEIDDGFMILGSEQRADYESEMFVVKTDSVGNELWRKYYNSPNWSYSPTHIFKTDSGYILTGIDNNYSFGENEDKVYPYMMGIDDVGNVTWQWWNKDNTKTAISYTGIRTDDGGYILSGYKITGQPLPNGDIYMRSCIMKLDVSKNKVWEKVIGYVQDDFSHCYLNGAVVNADNKSITAYGIQATQTHPNQGGWFGYLVKLSATGDSIWDKYYYLSQDIYENHNEFSDMIVNADGGYTLVGETTDMFNGGNGQQTWLMRIDSNGCVQDDFCRGKYPVGVEEVTNTNQVIKIYPNPANNIIEVAYTETLAANYHIYDIAGKVMASGTLNNTSKKVDIAKLNRGIYFISVVAGEESKGTGKFIKH